MKILILTLAALTIVIASSAQINKGAILVEGSMSFDISEADVDGSGTNSGTIQETTQFAFRPQIGFFTSQSWQLGVGLGYNFNQSTIDDPLDFADVKMTSNIFSINSYIRKYISINDKLFLTITGNVGYGFGKSKRDYQDDTYNTDTEADNYNIQVSIGPGLSYFVSNRWAITATFGQLYYFYNKIKVDDSFDSYESTNNNYGLSFRFNTFGVGVQYFLRNE